MQSALVDLIDSNLFISDSHKKDSEINSSDELYNQIELLKADFNLMGVIDITIARWIDLEVEKSDWQIEEAKIRFKLVEPLPK